MKKVLLVVISAIFLVVSVTAIINKNQPNIISEVPLPFKEEVGYGVSVSDPIAAKVGMDVLENGGNAVDAAIAISYVLGVVEPYGSGVGGGGGMLIAKEDKNPTFIDYREVAPESEEGTIGVPGFVKGMAYVHEEYGKKPLDELIQPAIDYADKGFEVGSVLYSRLQASRGRMPVDDLKSFYPNEQAIAVGGVLKQPELADVLRIIQEEGPDGFYEGDVAKALADQTDISLEDLNEYEIEEREPVMSTYDGYEIISAPPPFSGTTLIQMLKMMEKEQIEQIAKDDPNKYYYSMGQIKKIAYQDRISNISDPNFEEQSPDEWVADDYIGKLTERLHEKNLDSGQKDDEEHESTTHFVVIDKEGTTVSTTNTLSNFFGIGKQVKGFFLNNNADTFGSSGVNTMEGGKRARTFTAPTIIRDQGEWVMGIGSPGGTRIPQILSQVMNHHFQGDVSLKDAVEQSRFIFDKGDMVIEPELEGSIQDVISNGDYNISIRRSDVFYGGVQALTKDLRTNQISGVGDPRRGGVWESGR
ncbi:gamma-glutamyltransferase family protein [Metabacillus iocasae]|uniref:Gamma-glutamyltranspeptidase/glutathione hydrolase n=1 Tax=Priestia iocasae TaxID=2291674 RepID=A0ABS2QVR2_9BACI|nr:gamma-glutamyltranspeptidase/glutathione hydrolase [Metabacillus iocasae]